MYLFVLILTRRAISNKVNVREKNAQLTTLFLPKLRDPRRRLKQKECPARTAPSRL